MMIRWWSRLWRRMSRITDWMCRLIAMLDIAKVATTGDWQLETVYVETSFIGVGEQPHKIVLL